MTDSHPAIQPARHVAVASTRYAIASRLKSAQRDANTARAGCSKVRTLPARRCHKPTDRTDYNTLRRCVKINVQAEFKSLSPNLLNKA